MDCVPYSESVCRQVALKLGLQLGGNNFGFAIDNDYLKGCFAYKSGPYKGMAFYGRGGDNHEISKPFDENSDKYRPKGYDCRTGGNFYVFFSACL